METVLLLTDFDGTIMIVECWLNKYGIYSHNRGVRMNNFCCIQDAKDYCFSFNYKVVVN